MRKLFEEYGFLTLSVIVVTLLIAIASPVGASVKNSITGLITKFANTTNNVADVMGDDIANLNGELSGGGVQRKAGLYDADWNLLSELTPDMVENQYSIEGSTLATHVVIPSGTTRINDIAFGDMTHTSLISSVEIPDTVTEIGEKAFYGLPNLTSITIPASVTRITVDAFSTSDLTSITFEDAEDWYFVDYNESEESPADVSNPETTANAARDGFYNVIPNCGYLIKK